MTHKQSDVQTNEPVTAKNEMLYTIFESSELGQEEMSEEDLEKEGLHIYKCMYQFEPQGQDQLQINVGDILLIHQRTDSGWAAGHRVDMDRRIPIEPVGWFPESFVTFSSMVQLAQTWPANAA